MDQLSGILSVTKGGTGVTTLNALKTALGTTKIQADKYTVYRNSSTASYEQNIVAVIVTQVVAIKSSYAYPEGLEGYYNIIFPGETAEFQYFSADNTMQYLRYNYRGDGIGRISISQNDITISVSEDAELYVSVLIIF